MNGDSLPRDLVGRVHERSLVEVEARDLIGLGTDTGAASAGRKPAGGNGDPILGMIEREIGSALEELDSLKALHEDLDRDLVRSECRVRTDLHQLRPLPYGPDEKESVRLALKRRLEDLARERRGIASELHIQRRAQLERLAKLLERHRQLRGDGD